MRGTQDTRQLSGIFGSCVALLAIVLQPVSLGFAQSLAPGSSGGVLPDTPFVSTLPPQFDAAKAQGLAGIFTSCGNFPVATQNLNQVANNLSGGIKSKGAGGLAAQAMGGAANCPMEMGTSINTTCPGSDSPPDISGMTCETAAMNPSAVEQDLRLLQMAECANRCKKNKSLAIQGEIACLTNQAQALSSQVGTLSNLYQQNIQKMQSDIANIQSVQDDREAQLEDVTKKLGGDKDSGVSGLLQLQQQTKDMVAGIPAQIQQMKAADLKYVQDQKFLDEQVQNRTMALTMECFGQRPVGSYRCQPNGPPVTPKDYLLCQFENRQNRVGTNQSVISAHGNSAPSAVTQNQARAGKEGLEAILNQIVQDTATTSKIPTTPEEMAASGEASVQERSIADVESLYGSQLANYQLGDMNADSFVMSVMKSCNDRATRQTQIEGQRASTAVGKLKAQLVLEEQGIVANLQGLYHGYNQQFMADMSGLVGMNVPMDTSHCIGQPNAVQIQCLSDIQNTLQGLLNGSIPNSRMALQIKGNNPQTNINFFCDGLSGCVTTLQNVSRNIRTVQKQLANFKTQYVLKANQSVMGFTKQIAATLNIQSQQLTDRMKALNSALASIGIPGGMTVPTVKPEEAQYDEKTGLIKPPTNVLAFVGQFVSPPIPDVAGNSFGSALSGLASGTTNLDRDYSTINQSIVQLSNLNASCIMNSNKESLNNLVNLGQSSANCHNQDYCTSRLGELQQAILDIGRTPGLMPNIVGSLQSGIATACQKPSLPSNMPNKDTDPIGYKAYMEANAMSASRTGEARGCDAFFATLLGASKTIPTSVSRDGQFGLGSGRAW